MSSRRQENSSDDPFSCYNASKRAASSDPFADYNAKKSTVSVDGEVSRNRVSPPPHRERHREESSHVRHYREAPDRNRTYEGRHRRHNDHQRSVDDHIRSFRNESEQSGDINIDQYRRVPAFLQQGSPSKSSPPPPPPPPPAPQPQTPYATSPAPYPVYLDRPQYRQPPPPINGVREAPRPPPPPPPHPYWEGQGRRPSPHVPHYYPPAPAPPPPAPRHPPPPVHPGYHHQPPPSPHYPPPAHHAAPPAHHAAPPVRHLAPPRPHAPPHHSPHHPPPPPPGQSLVKPPNMSEIVKIMNSLKQNAQKDLEGSKALPPKPTDAQNPNDSAVHPRLGDSNYSSSPITYTKPKPPLRRGPDFTSMFTRTAEKYKSNWVTAPDAPSTSHEDEEEDNGNVINLSKTLEVDLNEVTESQANLLAKYLVHRERGLRAIKAFVPVREKKVSAHEEDSSAVETDRSIRNKFTERPDRIPGTVSCDQCKRYNLHVDDYRKHISMDFHCWMEGTFETAFPREGSVPRFSLVWCTTCAGFFMTTYEGMTVLGHEMSKEHAKNRSVCLLKYGVLPSIKFVLMHELKTTKVKIPPPHKCKYVVPREALNSYKAAYSKLCDRNLVS